MATDHRLSMAFGWALLAASSSSACLESRHMPANGRNQCTSCHGDARRAGDLTAQAAPPIDLEGNTSPTAPGVGAHQLHLNAGTTHAALACTECHVVPADVFDPGHIDHPPPAQLTFGTLARQGDRAPEYSFQTRSCSDTYCHRDAAPVWNAPRTSDQACGSCHALPPPAPHPQSDRCSLCHGAVVDANRAFVNPALHVDGIVEFNPQGCTGCHGDPKRAGDQVAQAAPPVDLEGNSDPSAPGVGAHQFHLQPSATHAAVACSECHLVPTEFSSPGHVDHPPPAQVTFGSLASQGNLTPVYNFGTRTCSGNYCHGDGKPVWIEPRASADACGSCHGLPPALPHPQLADCSRCHGTVIDSTRAFVTPALHVNGQVEVAPLGCSSCHGSATNAAPPTDLSGSSDRSSAGVGAHQVHLAGGSVSRPLACGECHVVPTSIGSSHPVGWGPAVVTFSGIGADNGVSPKFDPNTLSCTGTWCHGPDLPRNSASPSWTTVGPLPCNGCHGTPPPPPHTGVNNCSSCHPDVDSLGRITDRSLHVNGLINVNF